MLSGGRVDDPGEHTGVGSTLAELTALAAPAPPQAGDGLNVAPGSGRHRQLTNEGGLTRQGCHPWPLPSSGQVRQEGV